MNIKDLNMNTQKIRKLLKNCGKPILINKMTVKKFTVDKIASRYIGLSSYGKKK